MEGKRKIGAEGGDSAPKTSQVVAINPRKARINSSRGRISRRPCWGTIGSPLTRRSGVTRRIPREWEPHQSEQFRENGNSEPAAARNEAPITAPTAELRTAA